MHVHVLTVCFVSKLCTYVLCVHHSHEPYLCICIYSCASLYTIGRHIVLTLIPRPHKYGPHVVDIRLLGSNCSVYVKCVPYVSMYLCAPFILLGFMHSLTPTAPVSEPVQLSDWCGRCIPELHGNTSPVFHHVWGLICL